MIHRQEKMIQLLTEIKQEQQKGNFAGTGHTMSATNAGQDGSNMSTGDKNGTKAEPKQVKSSTMSPDATRVKPQEFHTSPKIKIYNLCK